LKTDYLEHVKRSYNQVEEERVLILVKALTERYLEIVGCPMDEYTQEKLWDLLRFSR
jgi:hypothetical protein